MQQPNGQPEEPVSAADVPTMPWADFLAVIQRERKALYMTLATSRCLGMDPEKLTIGVDGEMYARELGKAENRRMVETLAERFFGRRLSVCIEAVAASTRVEQPASAARPDEQLKRETLEHPTVKAALDILGGEVRAIRQPRRRSS